MSQEFYELMQTYRHSPVGNQKQVVKDYEAVIQYIWELLAADSESLKVANLVKGKLLE